MFITFVGSFMYRGFVIVRVTEIGLKIECFKRFSIKILTYSYGFMTTL